jgi:hypothetical protein
MNKKHLEFLSFQLTAMKDILEPEIFQPADAALDSAVNALLGNGDGSKCKKYKLKNVASNCGLTVEGILELLYKKNKKVSIPREYSVFKAVIEINKSFAELESQQASEKKKSKLIPLYIQRIFELVYDYRNAGSHAETRRISIEEIFMLLDALIVILEWYIVHILESDVRFDDEWKLNLSKYKEAFKMAFADGKIHPKERIILKKKATEFKIPDSNIKKLENELRLSYENGNNGASYFEQTMFYGDIYPAMDSLKRLVEEEKESEKIEILNKRRFVPTLP